MLISRLTTAALVVLCTAVVAHAQAFDEFDPAAPGWVMTPGVALGATFDDNPVLAGHGSENPNDTITSVAPSLDLTFRGKHTVFSAAYNGALVRYRTLNEFNSFDQGARLELRQQASRRVGFNLRNYYSASPTTDVVQVAGLPFIRTGTRQNEFIGGTTIQATRFLELSGSYRFQWLEFERPESFTTPLLDGGRTHAFTVGAMQAVDTHVKVGGSYTYQHAIVGAVGEVFDIQNGEGTVAVQLSPTVSLDAGAGFSHLSLPDGLGSRTGPAGRVALRKSTRHAMYMVSAMRSFVPAFGFGGSLRNSEISGGVRVPFAGTRGFVQGNVAWRDSEPVLVGELGLSAVWLETTLGYGLQRWLRLEVFYSGAFQDTTAEGGRIDRNRVGVQLVTLRPMRIQ